jgi:predicted DNA-binding protein YlxM (UPF0122 family)
MQWNEANINELRALHKQGFSAKYIAEKFNVSVYSIKGIIYRKKEMNLRRRPKYNTWDDSLEQKIEHMLKNSTSLTDIANQLNISYAALTSKMRRLDLRFTDNIDVFGYTPQKIKEQFNITDSQVRQLLNNQTIRSEARGRNLIVTKDEIIRWLNSGYALLYCPIPFDVSGDWDSIWLNAVTESLKSNASMQEIANTFNKSRMSISYYMKKQNFPSIVRHINSYNMCDRDQVNEWAKNHNMPTLPEVMPDQYFEEIGNAHSYKLYHKLVSQF